MYCDTDTGLKLDRAVDSPETNIDRVTWNGACIKCLVVSVYSPHSLVVARTWQGQNLAKVHMSFLSACFKSCEALGACISEVQSAACRLYEYCVRQCHMQTFVHR